AAVSLSDGGPAERPGGGPSRKLDPRGRHREPRDSHTQPEHAAGIVAIRALRAGHDVEVPQIIPAEADARHHRQRAADALALAAVGLEDDHGAASRRRDPDGAVLSDGESVWNALVYARQRPSWAHAAIGAHVVHADDVRPAVGMIEARAVGREAEPVTELDPVCDTVRRSVDVNDVQPPGFR